MGLIEILVEKNLLKESCGVFLNLYSKNSRAMIKVVL